MRELLHMLGAMYGHTRSPNGVEWEHFLRNFVSRLTFDRQKSTNSGAEMTARAAKSMAAEEAAAIEELVSDLEKRLSRISGKARRETAGASDEIGEFVRDALERIMVRVRENTADVTQSAADEAKRFSGEAFHKLADEVENRPLLMLGVAAGIGFLAGLANRR
jgi:ElaB/YqjD/DUF883 family membrane-anchored ribosome-binding protein